ncbi:MAG: hypothetical protein VXX04_02935, partial [Actinomycetota bacterium]|nr:hypothetical protein [Actinomycetota bacterium]
TLTLPALTGYYLVQDDTYGVGITLGALGSACLSNAAMISILFELFHRGIAPPPALPAPARMRRR